MATARARRVLLLVAAAALPLLVLAAAAIWRQSQDTEARIVEQQAATAHSAAATAGAFADGQFGALRALASAPSLTRRALHEEVEAVLARALAELPGLVALSLWDAGTPNIASLIRDQAPLPPGSLALGDRPFVQDVLATGRPAVGPAQAARPSGRPRVGLAVPVAFDDGTRGALLGAVAFDELAATLAAVGADRSVRIVVLDAQGSVFIHPDADVAAALPSLRERPDVRAALAGERGSRVVDGLTGEPILVGYAPVPATGWAVLVQQPLAEALAPVRQQVLSEAFVLVCTTLMMGVIAWPLGLRLGRAGAREMLARERAEQATRRLGALAEASRVFAQTQRDLPALLEAVVRQVAHSVGDGCVLYTVAPDGETLYPEALFHADGRQADLLRAALSSGTLRVGDGVAGRAVLLEDTVDVRRVDRDAFLALLPPALQVGVAQITIHSLLAVPLSVGGQTFGALTLWRSRPEQPYGEHDLALVQEIAGRAALAIQNARLFGAERTAHAAAEGAVQLRDRVVAAVAHDLKTPLTVIRGHAQMLGRVARGLSVPDGARTRIERTTAEIAGAVDRMARWLEELSDLAGLEPGRQMALKREPVDLVALAHQVAAGEHRRAGRHIITVEAGVPAIVGQWDRARLERVLYNLVGNAIKYSPQGDGVTIRVDAEDAPGAGALTVGALSGGTPPARGASGDGGGQPARWAVVRVTDRGIGIPAADLPRVFEPFHRAANAATTTGGTGVGLASVRLVVDQHGGTVDVESVEGSGSTFTVRLPLRGGTGAPDE